MDYQLYAKQNDAEPVARAEFGDDFAAETWARQWAADHGGNGDYLIRRADGGLSAQLFRTVGGQWFIMRQ